MFKDSRLEVVNIVAHFVLTVLIFGGYVTLRLNGIDDETMKLVVVAAASFFFGTTGQSMLTNAFKSGQGSTPPAAPPAAPTPQPVEVQQPPFVAPKGNGEGGV